MITFLALPIEVFAYIKSAGSVITDIFHGAIFSIKISEKIRSDY